MSTLGPYCRPAAVVGNGLLCPRLNCCQCLSPASSSDMTKELAAV